MSNKKLSRTPLLDIQTCVKNAGGNKFDMIVYTALRAREMSRKNKGKVDYFNAPLSALFELQENKNDRDQIKKV